MSFGVYRRGAVVFTFAGLRCEDFTQITVAPTEDDYTEEVSGNAFVTRSATENVRYQVSLELPASSNYNQVLAAIRNTDVNTDGGAGVAPMAIADPNGASRFAAEISWIRRPADMSFGAERGTVTWEFTAVSEAGGYIPGGNQL